jgi:TonB family protein
VPAEFEPVVRALRRRIRERLAYPWQAARARLGGTVEVEVELDGTGRLARADVVGGQAAGILRDAALRAVRAATPVPWPEPLAGRRLVVRLPVVFEAR